MLTLIDVMTLTLIIVMTLTLITVKSLTLIVVTTMTLISALNTDTNLHGVVTLSDCHMTLIAVDY